MNNELLYHAHRCLLFNEILIQQCNSWLSAEEGNKNMIREIEERNQKLKKRNRLKKLSTLLKRKLRINNE